MDVEKCKKFIKSGIGRSGKVLQKDGSTYKKTEQECIEILGVNEYERLKKLGDPSEDIPTPVQPTPTHILSMKWGKRLFVIVKDPQETEINTQCSGHNDKCLNFTFELSTGTSNEYNFLGTFLPIKRQDADGWIHKDSNLHQEFKYNTDNFMNNYIIRAMEQEGHKEKCLDSTLLFLNEFLERFGCWRQLQISAVLAKDNSVWNSLRVGQLLKEFVMHYNWIKINTEWRSEQQIKNFISEQQKITNNEKYSEKDVRECKTRLSEQKGIFPFYPLRELYIALEKLSKIDDFRTNLKNFKSFIQSLNGRKYEITDNGIFYERLNPMSPIHYDIPPQIKCTDEEQCAAVINQWLGENNALCETSDRTKSAHSKEKPKAEKAEKPKHVKTDDTYFSGWLREC